MSLERKQCVKRHESNVHIKCIMHHCKTWSYNQMYGHAHEPETVYMWNYSQTHSAICYFATVDV